LRRTEDLFILNIDDNTARIAADKVDSILISTSASITTDAIVLAIEHNIDIVFLNKFGNPLGRVWHSKLGSTTRIRRWQLKAEDTEDGLKLVTGFIIRKAEHQIAFAKDLKKNRPNKADEFTDIITSMEKLLLDLRSVKGTADSEREKIMGFEGMMSRNYFSLLSRSLPQKWQFQGRSRDPAKDPFNAMLNYGYGVLYSHVERGCIISGLDPYIGILHTDNYNKRSFVFDLIEVFRIYIDRAVMNLFVKKKIRDEYFDPVPGGVILNKNGKEVLMTAINEMFETKIKFGKRTVTTRSSIPLECHRIANMMIAKGACS
jgi:CRISPR-associated protein Cas1